MVDVGDPIHYSAVRPGTPVYAADGVEVGRVEAVLDNYREHIFDGIVFEDAGGELRFVDAPEVQITAEQGIVLRIAAAEAQRLGPPEKGHAKYRVNPRAGRLSRFFGGGFWKRH